MAQVPTPGHARYARHRFDASAVCSGGISAASSGRWSGRLRSGRLDDRLAATSARLVSAAATRDRGPGKQYFATPTTPLFKRTYDATGFFSHLQEAGFDVYAAFPAAEQAIANGNVAAFNAFVAGGSDKFFPSWPTGLLRQPSLGQEWDTHGPGITPDAVTPAGVAVGNGATPSGSVSAYANDDRKLTVSAEVVLVSTGQYSRLRAISGGFDSMSPSDIYCTKGAGCQCPQGSPQEGTKFKQLSSGAYYLALSGGPSTNNWSIAAYSLAAFCQQPLADNCLVGTWKLVSPPALPTTHVDIQKVDETATIAGGGTFNLVVDVVGSEAAGDITVTVELNGTSTVQAVAIHGIIQPRSADFSGLQVTAQLNGTPFLSSSLSQLFPGIESDLTPVAYRCGNGTLTLTSVSGQQWGFARA